MAGALSGLAQRKPLLIAGALLLALAVGLVGWRALDRGAGLDPAGQDRFGTEFTSGQGTGTDGAATNSWAASTGFLGRVGGALGALIGRSPGERTVAMSEKGKGRSGTRLARRTSPERALRDALSSPGGARRLIEGPRPESALPGALTGPAELLTLPPELAQSSTSPIAGLPPGLGGGSGGGGVDFGSVFPGGGISVGGGGGGGGGPGGGGTTPSPVTPPTPLPVTPTPTPTPPPPPPVPAVPEPGTWLMLLLGMGGVGASLRRGKESRIAAGSLLAAR